MSGDAPEFAWILNLDGPEAFAAAERARHTIADTPFQHVGAVTMSIGVCDLTPAIDVHELYERADQALYLAKAQGRNKTHPYHLMNSPQNLAQRIPG